MRIPRDWYGPQEELVPFGPAASDRPPEPLDASSFWSEDASAVHEIVEPIEQGHAEIPVPRERFGGRVNARAVVASVAVGLILIGLLTRVFGESRSHSALPAVAAIGNPAPLAADEPRAVARGRAAVSAKSIASRSSSRAASTRQALNVSHPQVSQTAEPTQVVYHASQPAYPASSTATYQPPAPSPTTHSYSGQGAASTASKSQPSQTAFGANGALGPMSSPDG